MEPAVFEISQLLPRLVSENGDQNILIFDLISPAFTVGSILDRESDSGSFVQAMRALGAVLATVHRALSLRQWGEDARLASIPRSIPWAMTLHKPAIAMLAKITQADWKALWFLQNQGEIAAQLERLGGQWQPEALIHGDIRLDNILVTSPTDGTDQSSIRLWIVDWEMVQFGDPAWDVAGALQDLVVHWVKTMPMSDELNAEERTSRATFPLAVLQRGSSDLVRISERSPAWRRAGRGVCPPRCCFFGGANDSVCARSRSRSGSTAGSGCAALTD